MIRIVELIEEHNPGGPPALPVGACAFSGCPDPEDRVVGDWPLCRRHADRIDGAYLASVEGLGG